MITCLFYNEEIKWKKKSILSRSLELAGRVIVKPFNKKISKWKEERKKSKKSNKEKPQKEKTEKEETLKQSKKVKVGQEDDDLENNNTTALALTETLTEGIPFVIGLPLSEDFLKTKEKKESYPIETREKDQTLKNELYLKDEEFDSEKQLEEFLIYNRNNITALKEYHIQRQTG